MSDDWRSRNTMTGREAVKVAGAILGLLLLCIIVAWVVTKLLHRTQPASPVPSDVRR